MLFDPRQVGRPGFPYREGRRSSGGVNGIADLADRLDVTEGLIRGRIGTLDGEGWDDVEPQPTVPV